MAVVARVAVAWLCLGIEGFLLRGCQHSVEGFGGLATPVCLGGMLGAQRPHAVNALGGGELGPFFVIRAGWALSGLQGGGEGGPGRFLGGGQLKLGLECFQALGAVLGTVAMVVALVPFSGLLWAFRRSGTGSVGSRWLNWRLLGQRRQCQGGQNGGGDEAALDGAESHGVSPFTG